MNSIWGTGSITDPRPAAGCSAQRAGFTSLGLKAGWLTGDQGEHTPTPRQPRPARREGPGHPGTWERQPSASFASGRLLAFSQLTRPLELLRLGPARRVCCVWSGQLDAAARTCRTGRGA